MDKNVKTWAFRSTSRMAVAPALEGRNSRCSKLQRRLKVQQACSMLSSANAIAWSGAREIYSAAASWARLFVATNRSMASSFWPFVTLALIGGLAAATNAANTVEWQLQANVPVTCKIHSVNTSTEKINAIAIKTTCNAERYELALHHDGTRVAELRAAGTSAGRAQINGGVVTIISSRPGYAITTVELATPALLGALSITLKPV
jgi:hypothetical protein